MSYEEEKQDRKIERLEAEIERLRAELEDALVEKQTALMPSAPRCYADARRQAAIEQLQAEGKIGPDAKPKEGLYGKYRISKADGSPVDPEADYFVLRLDTDPVARRAAREYSYMTVDRKLALDLQERITKYNPKMEDCINLQFFGMERPRVWQITDERKAAIEAMCNLSTDIVCPACGAWIAFDDIRAHMAVLRAMLEGAGQ